MTPRPSHASSGVPRPPPAGLSAEPGSHAVALGTLAAALAILAGVVAAGALHLRRHLCDHLVQRDGQVLYAVALARQYANGSGEALAQRLAQPTEQLALALDISQLRAGTLGVRLFDSAGHFVTAFPPAVMEAELRPDLLAALSRLEPVSVLHPQAGLTDFFWIQPAATQATAVPLLEVNIPLHSRGENRLLGAAQLLLDGSSLTREFARVDRHLWALAVGFYAVAAPLLAGVLIWAYRRLRQAQALIEERTARLLRANHELALAAKTSALGAVTAHLIPGLSNPLANLQDFIASRGDPAGNGDWHEAAAAARRMQQLVHDVVRVLGETRTGDRYELTLAELTDVLLDKVELAAREAGVRLVTEVGARGKLSNHHANLVLLILENLIHNALKVTPRDHFVRVRWMLRDGMAACEVADQGPGIPPEMLPRLFTPCRSTHGGSGLGLALSRQLAQHLGATLELQSNTPAGCVFALTLPREMVSPDATPIPTRPLGSEA